MSVQASVSPPESPDFQAYFIQGKLKLPLEEANLTQKEKEAICEKIGLFRSLNSKTREACLASLRFFNTLSFASASLLLSEYSRLKLHKNTPAFFCLAWSTFTLIAQFEQYRIWRKLDAANSHEVDPTAQNLDRILADRSLKAMRYYKNAANLDALNGLFGFCAVGFLPYSIPDKSFSAQATLLLTLPALAGAVNAYTLKQMKVRPEERADILAEGDLGGFLEKYHKMNKEGRKMRVVIASISVMASFGIISLPQLLPKNVGEVEFEDRFFLSGAAFLALIAIALEVFPKRANRYIKNGKGETRMEVALRLEESLRYRRNSLFLRNVAGGINMVYAHKKLGAVATTLLAYFTLDFSEWPSLGNLKRGFNNLLKEVL